MASDTKMLQMLLDGQSSIKKDLKRVEKNLGDKIDTNGKRIDKLGMQLANLEDDAPTIEEFDDLEKRVTKLEHPQFATN